jgi:hypothetical protein
MNTEPITGCISVVAAFIEHRFDIHSFEFIKILYPREYGRFRVISPLPEQGGEVRTIDES